MQTRLTRDEKAGLLEIATSAAHRNSRTARLALYALSLFLDTLALCGGFAAALLIRDERWLSAGGLSFVALAIPLFWMFSIAREAQSVETLENRSLGLRRAMGALVATAVCLILLTFVIKIDEVSRLGFGSAFVISSFGLVVSRWLSNIAFHKWMGGVATACLLILDGMKAEPDPHMDRIDVGVHGIWPDISRPEMLDAVSSLVAPYDRVVVGCVEEHRRAWSLFLRGSEVGGEILVADDLLEGAVAIGHCGNKDSLILSLGPLSLASRIQKRAFDLAISIPLVILLSPLLIAVAIAIKLESPGPILFRQIRVGEGNRQFRIFKFRSMREDSSDPLGTQSTLRDDDRVTRVGALIRRTSIDELPQLLNVLKGDMSLVGPRPHALGSLADNRLFWEVTEHYWLRHALKPGITGLAQIRGYRGATERREDLTKRLRSDLEYLSTWSVANDFLILLRTLRVLVHRNAF